MSWDSYIDNVIEQSKDSSGTPSIDKVCIIGMDGSSWTSAAHANALKLHPEEPAAIAGAFKNKDFSSFMTSGIKCEGVKYQFLREEDQKLVLAKKKDKGALTIQASKTAVVIAHVPEGRQQGNANKAVAVIADYLESNNM